MHLFYFPFDALFVCGETNLVEPFTTIQSPNMIVILEKKLQGDSSLEVPLIYHYMTLHPAGARYVFDDSPVNCVMQQKNAVRDLRR